MRLVISLFLLFLSCHVFSADDRFETGKSIGLYLGTALQADMLKESRCGPLVKKFNPNFYEKKHFQEAVQKVRIVFKNRPEILDELTNEKLVNFRSNLGTEAEKTIQTFIGMNPAPSTCGNFNAQIDGQLERYGSPFR